MLFVCAILTTWAELSPNHSLLSSAPGKSGLLSSATTVSQQLYRQLGQQQWRRRHRLRRRLRDNYAPITRLYRLQWLQTPSTDQIPPTVCLYFHKFISTFCALSQNRTPAIHNKALFWASVSNGVFLFQQSNVNCCCCLISRDCLLTDQCARFRESRPPDVYS